MADAARRNGLPEPEVIVNFADGLSYSKAKLEEAMLAILDKTPVRPPKAAAAYKKEDVDLIVNELEIPRARAEKALSENDNDVQKALRSLVFV